MTPTRRSPAGENNQEPLRRLPEQVAEDGRAIARIAGHQVPEFPSRFRDRDPGARQAVESDQRAPGGSLPPVGAEAVRPPPSAALQGKRTRKRRRRSPSRRARPSCRSRGEAGAPEARGRHDCVASRGRNPPGSRRPPTRSQWRGGDRELRQERGRPPPPGRTGSPGCGDRGRPSASHMRQGRPAAPEVDLGPRVGKCGINNDREVSAEGCDEPPRAAASEQRVARREPAQIGPPQRREPSIGGGDRVHRRRLNVNRHA